MYLIDLRQLSAFSVVKDKLRANCLPLALSVFKQDS